MRRLRPQEKKRVGDFFRPLYLGKVRGLPRKEALEYDVTLNVARLRVFVARLEKRLYWDTALRRLRLKNRRVRRAARVAERGR